MTADNRPMLFVLGDSISLQYGVHLEQYVADRFRYRRKDIAGDAFANLDLPQGANGGDSRMVLDYLTALRDRGDLQADLMLLNCGLHDIKTDTATNKQQVAIDDYRRNLRAIVPLIREAGVSLAWVRTTCSVDAIHNKPGATLFRYAVNNEAYCAVADDVMAELNVPVIDLRTFTRSLGKAEDIFCDHVHYHDPIRQLQAAYLAGWIASHASALSPHPSAVAPAS